MIDAVLCGGPLCGPTKLRGGVPKLALRRVAFNSTGGDRNVTAAVQTDLMASEAFARSNDQADN